MLDSVKHNRYFFSICCCSHNVINHSRLALLADSREDGAAAPPPHPPPASKILRGEEAPKVAPAAGRSRAETGGQQQRSETTALPDPRADLDEELRQEGEMIKKKKKRVCRPLPV